MTPLAMLVFISFTMLTTTDAMNYTVTRIINETLTLHKNTRFLLEITGEGNDSMIYMTINEPITEEDELLIDIVAERFDGMKFPVPNNPLKLCQTLSAERATNLTWYIQQLHVSRAFNLEGETCPILPGKRKIVPYMFPRNVSFLHDLGCGTFDYKVGIIKNVPNNPNAYVTLISSKTTVEMVTDNCSNTLM
ncbi:hypothetical protein KPH14_010344 [Odynerus spinipes]|uniref:Uncharacterized protein n=1 Tax=Odynerus spinipes TaxID=1348599 RepID=A0AAD9RU46_9HYME|nr:hypothetical protein KPH14_010344 [Odynerus spinipes]